MIMKIGSLVKQVLTVGVLSIALSACGGAPKNVDGSNVAGLSAANDIGSSQYLAKNVLDRVFFGVDQSSLDAASMDVLRTQAEWLKKNKNISITVEGHADERGTRDYNLALGARRASAVRDALVSFGVSPEQVSTISYGKERPVSVCSENRCWSKNRRSVTVIR
jgi:peptidoglycan-associated lipoprotein